MDQRALRYLRLCGELLTPGLQNVERFTLELGCQAEEVGKELEMRRPHE